MTFGSVLNTPPLITRSDASETNPDVSKAAGGTVIGDTTRNTYSSGAIAGGIPGLKSSVTFSFPAAGTYFYRSLFHPDSLGEIDVVPAGKPVSANPPDTGASYKVVLRSVNKMLDQSLPVQRWGGGNSAEIEIGAGDGNASLTYFSPAGITIKAGSTITWVIKETSGDPHALVFFPAASDNNVPLYTGLAADGGLIINKAYRKATLPSGTTVMTSTVKLGTRFTSGLLYGSSVNAPSSMPSSYSLTFQQVGGYIYEDPFLPGNNIAYLEVIP